MSEDMRHNVAISEDLDLKLNFAREALLVEAAAITRAANRLDESFSRAIDLLTHVQGKVITTGVGKSGIAARKIAATLTSTGCPAVYLHPSEAMHGDLGIVAHNDVVIALSNGGESEELLAILPALLARDTPIIAIVGNLQSTLASRAAVCLDASIEKEACPLNLAPTTSVVVAMALGDALAMTLQKRKGLSAEDYARNHPGGRLGRRLTLRVKDVMPAAVMPQVQLNTGMMEVLMQISACGMGAVCVLGEGRQLLGIITDNDIRRGIQRTGADALQLSAQDFMNPEPAVVVRLDQLAYEAMRLMEDRDRPVSVAPVLEEATGMCAGMIRIHDMLRAGL
jgi:arabinose-5-phosphate isomerase